MSQLERLSKIVDLKKIDSVKKPISKANGLPNECYTSDDYIKYERDTVLSNNWTVIGSASSIPEVGDVKPYEYLIASIDKFYNQNELLDLLNKNNFSNTEFRNLSNGISAIHSGWKI